MDTSEGRVPFNVGLYAVSQVIILLAMVPAFFPKFARILAFLLVGWITYQIVCTQTSGDPSTDAGIGSVIICQLLAGIDFALLTSPEELKDFHGKDDSKVTERSFARRVFWALRLQTNVRGIGWAHEPSLLPPRPSPSIPRWEFVVSRLLRASACILLAVGVTYIIDALNPGFIKKGLLLTEAPLHWRALGVACFGTATVCLLTTQHSILSAVVVGFGLSSPERWPLLFGSPLQMWSVRRFWRLFWHQMLRRVKQFTVSWTSALMRCLFPKAHVKSAFYQLTRLYIAFLITGFVHMGGDRMLLGRISSKSFTFFMLQPFGIAIEIFVSHLWCQLYNAQSHTPNKASAHGSGHKDEKIKILDHKSKEYKMSRVGIRINDDTDSITPLWIRCVGFVWVAVWLLWTAAYMIDPLCSMNMLFYNPWVDLRRLGW